MRVSNADDDCHRGSGDSFIRLSRLLACCVHCLWRLLVRRVKERRRERENERDAYCPYFIDTFNFNWPIKLLIDRNWVYDCACVYVYAKMIIAPRLVCLLEIALESLQLVCKEICTASRFRFSKEREDGAR